MIFMFDKSMKINCSFCKKIINRSPSNIGKNNFCGKKCRESFHRDVKHCVICGSEFSVPKYLSKSYATCSNKECRKSKFVGANNPNYGKKKWIEKLCKVCNKPFKSYNGIKRSTCGSPECISKNKSGKSNPNWRGGKSIGRPERFGKRYQMWRRKIFERDGYTCQTCGYTRNFHAHHIRSWDLYPELRYEISNGITLCKKCHEKTYGLSNKLHKNKLRFCFDLDGTICENKMGNMTYSDVKPFPNAIETLRWLKDNGHTVIIYTGRHMKTCNGNEGLVWAKQGKILLDWLEKYHVPYDELYLKPHYDLAICDATHTHIDWISTKDAIETRLIKGPRGPENP